MENISENMFRIAAELTVTDRMKSRIRSDYADPTLVKRTNTKQSSIHHPIPTSRQFLSLRCQQIKVTIKACLYNSIFHLVALVNRSIVSLYSVKRFLIKIWSIICGAYGSIRGVESFCCFSTYSLFSADASLSSPNTLFHPIPARSS